jgi:hypothetical protein
MYEEEEMLGGIMDGSTTEMKRLRRLLDASRALDAPPSPEGNAAIARASGLNGDMEITEVGPPASGGQPSVPSSAPPGWENYGAPKVPKPTSAAPPVPQPPTPDKIGHRFSFNPHSPKAEEYEGIVREFQGNRMSGEGGAGTYRDPSSGDVRNMPQVYGQDGSPADPNEGPLTPQQTYDKMAQMDSVPGAALLDRKKHTLGYGLNFGTKNEARKKHYADYVASSEAARNQQRAAQQERAMANRANIEDRNARTMQQMGDYNAMQGGGRMGSYDDQGPSVSRQGGVTILRGLGGYRRMDGNEMADMESKQADAAWKRSRPADAMQDNQRQMLELQRKMNEDAAKQKRFTESFNQRESFFRQGDSHRKDIEKRHAAGQVADFAKDEAAIAKRMEAIAQMMKIKLEAAKQSTWGGFGGPDPSARDAWIDEKTMQADTSNKVPGDFDRIKDMLATEVETLLKINPKAQLPPSVMSVYEMLQGG